MVSHSSKRDGISLPSKKARYCFVFVLVVSWFTYFQGYDKPNQFIWDEEYHVVTAQKYLNNTFYMTVHPPLGKMLIALGQHMFYSEQRNDHLIDLHKAGAMPEDEIRLKGYRMVPVFLVWLTVPLLLLVFFLITRSPVTSTLLLFLFIFDNALIAHMRAAMLEGPLIFFTVCSILLFLLLFECKEKKILFGIVALLFGVAFASALAVKVLAIVLVLLIPAVLVKLLGQWRKMITFLLLCLSGFLITYVSVWYVHIQIARDINPALENGGYHWVSEEYRARIDEGTHTSLAAVPVAIRDYIWKMRQKSPMEPLNFCDRSHRGSPPVFWPFGARSVRYWTHTLALDDGYRYLYLQSNPVVWYAGLLGVVLSFSYLAGVFLFAQHRKSQRTFYMATFLALYISYMVGVSMIDRMMYLYHYFIPLLLSFLLFGLVVMEIRSLGRWEVTAHRRNVGLGVLGALIVLAFLLFSPLTYFQPLTDEQFAKRSIFPLWELRCKDCEPSNIWWTPVPKSSLKDTGL